MFSTRFESLRSEIEGYSRDSSARLTDFREGDPGLARLFWNHDFGRSSLLDHRITTRAEARKQEMWRGEVRAIVPLYVTSICRERCLYCNYRAANTGLKIDRIRLTDDQLRSEAEHLIRRGYRTIELVYASDPRMQADVICRHVELVQGLLERAGGGMVGVNAEPFSEQQYRSLRDAGTTFSIVWMETYDRDRYRELHPGTTPKTNFEGRLDSYERALAAGIEVGMGVLSGLSDWRRDWSMLMQHEAYLRDQYGRGASILGIPRLKPAVGAEVQSTPFIPTEQEFLVALALHNVFAPDVTPFISTREEWELSRRMTAGGGCLFTFDCSTIPGGYSLGASGNQFPSQSYDPVAYSALLGEMGLTTRFEWYLTTAAAEELEPALAMD